MKKKLLGLFIFVAVVLLTLQVNIIWSGFKQVPKKSDAIVVLGCRLWGDQPSHMLTYRLNKALELYEEGYASTIIVSGAQGEDEWITEAAAMKAYLVDKGIDSEVILKEENSFSTFQNLYYSKEIMDKQALESAIIVTNAFHVHRALMIGNRLGMDVSSSSAKSYPNPALIVRYYVREVFAYMKDFLFSH
ncbi:YdcF family protein [Clostridium formicaceticum]|uniref:Vancomycin high temperature exclusion protein n=1 Tax=Clostridium formicaceticum TaxID=1497 RepID=A0AAC9RQ12_9CLOT|nr:YdcF family protein [Clostridium formicaceticum]AOY77638.1 hypothetical protein BJL90_18310 [Clostridium formicaceticum]ARE88220.1 vancomycin high temperature exclusion protein [Clostridium formicaceticum]